MSQYIITDGERFIYKNHSNKFVPTTSESMADVYPRKKAEAIWANQLSKPLKKVFRVEKYDNPPDKIKQVSNKNLQDTEKVMISENVQRWLHRISDLNGLASDALHRKEELLCQLSDVDRELCDVFHYIEFCNLNAAQGYNAYRMIKDRRIKRRSIKNELDVLSIILSKKISETATDEIKKCIKGMDNRKYEPRVLYELFDL